MFRMIPQRLTSSVTAVVRRHVQRPVSVACVRHSSHSSQETDEEFDARYEQIFNNPNIDHWQIRKALSDLQGMDLVPEPRIVIAALKACRRLNDYALSVRFLEAVQDKCGRKVKEIWPYVHQEIKPTLDELGILTPEEMGYSKPELALQDVYDIHG